MGDVMKPLILTDRPMSRSKRGSLADVALDLSFFDFVWGPQPSSDEVAAFLGPLTAGREESSHWSTWGDLGLNKRRECHDLGLAEFCLQYEAVELWFDTQPSAQLKLAWLLDYFRAFPEIVGRLKLRLVDLEMIDIDNLDRWKAPVVEVTETELATASAAWQAWRSPTPAACFDLLSKDLSALPLLRPVLIDLLEELPSRSTGLGASELRMLELIARGYSRMNALFHLYQLRQMRIFGEWHYGYLLDGLAFGPRPAVAGLDEELRTLDRNNLRDRHAAYLRSRLSITEFGKAILAHKEDFSRHNPIDRWWGGTHLTNDKLWRWDPVLLVPSGM
jgi:hypothetical protein